MPVEPNYSIPSWIHGANPLQALEGGASLGIRIAESNQRAAIAYAEMQRRQQEFQQHLALQEQQLQQEQEIAQQRFQAQQQVQEQNQMREDQKLKIDRAYKQGQLGLKKQQLEMTKEAAAQKANSSGKFIQILNTLETGYVSEEGMTPEQARAKALPVALQESGMFQYMNPSSLAQMVKSVGAGQWKQSPGGANYWDTGTGQIHFEPKPVPNPVLPADKAEIGDITAKIRALDKRFEEEQNPEKKGQIEDELIRLAEDRSARLKKAQKVAPVTQAQPDLTSQASAPTEAASPYKDGAKLRKGNDLYEVRGGLPVLVQKNAFPDNTQEP